MHAFNAANGHSNVPPEAWSSCVMMPECQANMQHDFFPLEVLFDIEKGLGHYRILFFFFLFKQTSLIKTKKDFSGLHMSGGNVIKI